MIDELKQTKHTNNDKQESRAVAGKPRDAAANFDRCRQLFVSFDSFSLD